MIPSPIQKGFTIIELIVSVAIFAFMTAFLVAKYGNFNQSILLTNLAYDVALTIRNAQTYGLNVKSRPVVSGGVITQNYSSDFTPAYGVHFDKGTTGSPPANTQMIFFADTTPNGAYDAGEEITKYNLRGRSIISDICAGVDESSCTGTPTTLDVTFKRPDPDAVFSGSGVKYAIVTVRATGGSTKRIALRSTGQITVLHN